MKQNILVVGAGPAGLIAGIEAQKSGCLILEKMSRPGIKLALTGNGRGNITNASPVKTIQQAFFEHGDFLRPALQNLSPKKLRVFFSSLGLSTKEEQGRVFPASMRAKDIVECLQTALHKVQVPILYQHRVTALYTDKNEICGVEYNTGEKKDFFPTRAVILTCGGMARPQTGSSGDGYALARSVGHTLTPCLPALTPLLTADKAHVQTLQGISLPAVKATLSVDDMPAACEHGDILFTHFGLSGPAILDISRFAAAPLKKGQKVNIELDLFPDTPFKQLDSELTQLASRHGKKQVLSILSGMLPARVARFCLDQNSIDPGLQAGRLDAGNRKNLTAWMKKMSFTITETGSFKRAMLTRGGISLEEVNAKTLESHLIKGLFFAGELLDLDGKSGGYNLQAAFSTGALAGKSAAEKVMRQGL